MAERIKITYATLRNDNEELHAQYDAGIEKARARLGAHHPNWVGGKARDGEGAYELRSPIDRDVLVGTYARGTRADANPLRFSAPLRLRDHSYVAPVRLALARHV